MKRTEVIQRILDKKKAPAYLEIGMGTGKNFFKIKARQKAAVDPHFKFPAKRKLAWLFRNPWNLFAKYYEMTSDDFFAQIKGSFKFDVVFIDGLHSHGQTLKDVENALTVLKEGGVIVMHDCNPSNEAAAQPASNYDHAASLNLPGWTGQWSGDVWKTICLLRSTRKDLRIFVLNCDHGLGIITRGTPENPLNLSKEEIEGMSYETLSRDREKILNLKDERYLFKFLDTI